MKANMIKKTAALAAAFAVLVSGVPVSRFETLMPDAGIRAEAADTGWGEAYAQYAREYGTGRFMTVYIDDDNIPEMVFAQSWLHICPASVVTYYEGECVDLGSFSQYGMLYYHETENQFLNIYTSSGVFEYYIFSIVNGEAVKQIDLCRNTNTDSFKVNGETVTETEYNNICSEYDVDTLDTWNVTGYDYGMVDITEANIEKYILEIAAAQTPTDTPAVTGDINQDNSIDISDASDTLTIYAKQAAGLSVDEYSENQIKAADVDGSGTVDISDASAILAYYAQNAAGLEPAWDTII